MKVGLSMGLLLVGIVGALFFRRGPEKPSIPPPLESAALLDEQIADNANVPYDLGQPDIPAPAPAMSSAPPSGFVSQSAPGAAATAQMDSRPPSPTPIGATPPSAPASTAPTTVEPNVAAVIPPPAPPAHNSRWEPIAAGTSRAPATVAKSGAKTGATHVVSKGDTLSTIASQHLGDQSRYREIYEANRNQMKSPNDLREGMTLQIPGGPVPPASLADLDAPTRTQPGIHSVSDRASSAAADSAAKTSEPGSAPAFSHDQPSGRRFIAVPRGPFSAGRVAPGSTPATTSEKVPAKRLEDPTANKAPEAKPVEGTLPHISTNEAESLISNDGPGGRRRPLRYRVRKGETLEQIAARFYGDKAKAQKILDANRELLPTKSALRDGMELLLPPND